VSRRAAALLIAAALVVVALAVALAVARRRHAPPVAPRAAAAAAESPEPGETAPALEAWTATLWLPSESERLSPATTRLASAPDAHSRATAVVAALLAAQPEAPRAAVFPAPVAVGRLLLVDGTAYVDLRPEGGGEPPASGSNLELLRVYAIVHTLVRNVPEVRQVVLLWNGLQRPGFAGHVDTGHPLRPRAELEGS
jgi:hypothetical protein